MDEYGFCITKAGLSLIAKLTSGSQLRVSKVMIGGGKVPESTNPRDLTDLVSPIANATSTDPVTKNTTTSFIIEYRNDMNGGLKENIYINEFGVFAIDPEDGEILLYYGTLGLYPEPVVAYEPGDPIVTRRYPVSIGLSEDVEVILEYPAEAWVIPDDIEAMKGAKNGLASLDENALLKPEQRAMIDDADGVTKYTLGVENGKLYFRIVEDEEND